MLPACTGTQTGNHQTHQRKQGGAGGWSNWLWEDDPGGSLWWTSGLTSGTQWTCRQECANYDSLTPLQSRSQMYADQLNESYSQLVLFWEIIWFWRLDMRATVMWSYCWCAHVFLPWKILRGFTNMQNRPEDIPVPTIKVCHPVLSRSHSSCWMNVTRTMSPVGFSALSPDAWLPSQLLTG